MKKLSNNFLQRITFNVFLQYVSLGVDRSLPLGPCGLAIRRLPWMQEVMGRYSPRVKKFIFHILLYLNAMRRIVLYR
jgi:hypothetical protein